MTGGRGRSVVLFGGTSEGREIAEAFAGTSLDLTVCVATDQGAEMLKDAPNIRVRVGRLTASEMERMIRDASPCAVVDATHPFAVEASKNIAGACEAAGARYERVVRASSSETTGAAYVDGIDGAIDLLNERDGRILLAVGAKTLTQYARVRGYRERIWARALPTSEILSAAHEIGLPSDRLILMQGPFSTELNVAMMRKICAKFIVTKESGGSGGFDEKLEAARVVGATAVVIRRPTDETGMSVDECAALIESLSGASRAEKKKIYVIGTGPGADDMLTARARGAISRAGLVIGSRRCVEAASRDGRTSVVSIDPDEIARAVRESSVREIAVLMSGDTGAFSGAKKLLPKLDGLDVEVVPGVSSIAYLCARVGESWDDAAIMSAHGREANFAACVRANEKTILLAGGDGGTARVIDELCRTGLGYADVIVGEDLSSSGERITRGTADELRGREFASLSALIVLNHRAVSFTPGMPDEAFTRGSAPMTKSEVRAVIMSKLRPEADSVCWDVGAGTGSVSVEMALAARRGSVWAIEREDDAIALIEENSRAHAANVRVVRGAAPDATAGLPAPTHVFIGGSGGHIVEIIDAVREANADARVVISAVTAETFAAALTKLKADGARALEIAQVSVARGRRVGGLHMMTAQSPITLLSYGGAER